MRRFIFLTILIAALSLFCCANAESLFYIGSYENETSNGVWNSEHTMLEAPFILASELDGYTQEQIDYVINELYAYGYTKEDLFDDLYEGWSDDESLYVCYGDIEVSIPDELRNGDTYRVAVFCNSDENGLCAAYGFIDTLIVEEAFNMNESFYVTISNQPGLYRDITVVVTGNNMVSTKTFDVQVIEYPSYYGYSGDNDYTYGLVYGNNDSKVPELATREIRPYDEAKPSIPNNDFIIHWPADGSIHTGYEGVTEFSNEFSIRTHTSIKKPEYAYISLTYSSTGSIVAEGKQYYSGYSETETYNHYYFSPSYDSPFQLPENWESGEYRLTIELEGIGSHYVDIILEKEEQNPTEYYEPYTVNKLRFLFGQSRDYYYEDVGEWNDDHSVFTAGENSCYMILRVAGMEPSKRYIYALAYTTESGYSRYIMDYITEDEPVFINLATKAGTYEDLVLILTGNDETIIHPFTCVVPNDIEEWDGGIVFGDIYCGIKPVEEDNIRAIHNDYRKMIALQPKYTETGVIRYSENSILPEINVYLEQMKLIETDAFLKYIRYANTTVSDTLLPSFAIHSPNVSSEQVEDDLANPVHAANWAVHEAFSFQQDNAFMYCEDAFIDIQALNTYFGEKWIDLCALEFASGTASDSTGAVYNWMPVYYDDGQGGFHENKLYLFVYITYPGADDEYLAPFNYFNPLLYNEYHTVKLMITDQSKVYEIMNKLRSLNYAFEHMVDTTKYVHLKEGASGEYVRRLQVRLTELGYLTSSVDGEFTPPVTDAVKAYQADHGLEATGTANAELQKMILDPTYEKQLLLAWLEGHDESKESDKE